MQINKKLIILFITVVGSCRSAKVNNEIQEVVSDQTTLFAEYDIFNKPRQLVLSQKGNLICDETHSDFYWAFGDKGFQQIEDNGVVDGWFQDEIGNVVLKDYKNKTVVHREIYFMTPYTTRYPIEPINWSISNEFKMIGKFQCRKAFCKFNGRNYIAWFTFEIPLKDGPWKFYGLPGLILEISDEKNEYVFKLSKIIFPYKAKTPRLNLTTESFVSKNIFYNAYEMEFQKLQKRILSKQNDNNSMEVKMNFYNPQEIFKAHNEKDY
jgi:GLPGLI family protein